MNDDNIKVHNIGKADVLCEFCGSLKFSHESNAFCCRRGNGVLPQLLKPPDTILELHKNNMFLKNIVAFNNLMALASLGCEEPEDGIVGYRSTFKVQGKIYHRIGSLLPDSGTEPKFGQLCFYDIDHELENRMKLMSNLDQNIVNKLLKSLHDCNTYIRSFKAAVELNHHSTYDLLLTANQSRKPVGAHCRQYNLPSHSEVAAIVPGFRD